MHFKSIFFGDSDPPPYSTVTTFPPKIHLFFPDSELNISGEELHGHIPPPHRPDNQPASRRDEGEWCWQGTLRYSQPIIIKYLLYTTSFIFFLSEVVNTEDFRRKMYSLCPGTRQFLKILSLIWHQPWKIEILNSKWPIGEK